MKIRFTEILVISCVLILKCHVDSEEKLFGCTSSDFRCRSGECIDSVLECNREFDCADGSDEENCDCQLQQNGFKCRDSKCISIAQKCDGYNDCSDGEDEKNCETRPPSNPEMNCSYPNFLCSNHQRCLPAQWACDGTEDCTDGSDETIGCKQKKCDNDQFQCKSNGRCIYLSLRCNGWSDCDDNSDEKHCEHPVLDMSNCTLNNGKFACKDRLKCIDVFQACDDKEDCLDGSDEGGSCLADRHAVCTNCTHHCQLTPQKAVCICDRGFAVDGNNTCRDVNECEEYGICDQKCINVEGSYSCSCDFPYTLQHDKKTCKMAGEDALLFYTSASGIKSVHLQSLRSRSVVNYKNPLGVAVAGSDVYWTVVHHESPAIYKMLLDDYKPHMIITSGLGIPEDLDVDWITGNIYFTDSKFKHIGVCNNEGYICTILHQKNIDKPRSISLSPENGLLFWTDWGSKPLIGKSGMDGSNVEILVSENVFWPNGVSTDTPNGRVYWVDAKNEIVESIKFDGTDRRAISSDYVKAPFSITVFENKLYWSNLDGNEIVACDKFTGKNQTILIRDTMDKIFSIHVQHPLHQTKVVENPCSSNPCSDMCLLAPGSKKALHFTCACPEGKELGKSLRICHAMKSERYLLVAFKNKVYFVEYRYLGRPRVENIVLGVESISSMAYEHFGDKLFVADSKSAVMKSYNLAERRMETLPVRGITYVPSMQYDDHGNNLYWCDHESLTIEAMSLKTFSKTIVLSGTTTDFPTEIALAPSEGYMFVAFVMSNSRIQIDRLSMDGSLTSRSRFLGDELRGPVLKMFFDAVDKRLFWADISTGRIESVNANGEDRILHVITSDVVSIAHMDNTLFWTKNKSPYLNWLERSDVTEHINHLRLDIGEGFGKDDNVDDEMIIVNPHNFVGNKSSSCWNKDVGCSHLCLVSSESPEKSVCACPIGYALAMDGATCKQPQKCSSKQFTCFTGECISMSKVCDRRKDCLHGDDESVDVCHQLCPEGQFLCHDRTKCIDAKLRCNGEFDCSDQSDENCHTNCTEGMFKCDHGECIETQFRCDGKVDCIHGLDERNCHEASCDEKKFKCESGQCIPLVWHCDGENDCTDGTDEINCPSVRVCHLDDFHCTNGECVEISAICNGHDDCGDNSDEDVQMCMGTGNTYENSFSNINRTAQPRFMCNSGIEFQCETKSGQHCIPLSSRCDGKVNCLNGIDEHNCSLDRCPEEHEFRCKQSKKCIPHEWVCDHFDDCGDNSDETKIACLLKNVTRKECGGFRCANGECIELKNVCNDIADCSDKSDEGGLCGKCGEFGCSEKCHEDPNGPYCSCPHGFELGVDNKTCHDIDECQLNICAQNCTNTPGSFFCSCFSSKFTLKSDRVSCKAIDEPTHFVIASVSELRIFMNPKIRAPPRLFTPFGSMFTAIDVDNKNGLIYIVRDYSLIAKIDAQKWEIEKIETPSVYGIAADWITKNVYFIQASSKIMVVSFSSKKMSLVYDTNGSTIISSIAVDPVAGYLFWYEEEGKDRNLRMGMVKRADCNGENALNITSTVFAVENIAIDSYEKYLYLYEKLQGVIKRINYDGSNPTVVLRVESHVASFSLFGNSIYWLSEDSHIHPIRKCKIYGLPPRKCEVIKSSLKHIRYFAILQKSLQNNVPDPCAPSVCPDICTSTPTGPKCLSCDVKSSSNCSLPHAEIYSDQIKSASSFGTTFAYFVILCLVVTLGYLGYRYRKPKSQLFQRFHFHNTSLNRSEKLCNSYASGINEIVTNKAGDGFLESSIEESNGSEFLPIGNKTSREPLLKNSSYL